MTAPRRRRSCGSSRPPSKPWGRTRLSTDPGSIAPTPDANVDAGADDDARRPTVDERRARRDEITDGERDRYDSLLRHLQAGRQLSLEPRRSRRRIDLQVNRIGLKLLIVAAVVAAVWLGAIVVTDRMRDSRLDTWTGPDATVQSGYRLDGCNLPTFSEDSYFPTWIRFNSRIYRWANLSAPISEQSIPSSYEPTRYRLGTLEIYRIVSSQSGLAGERILVRNGESDAGAVYLYVPECI